MQDHRKLAVWQKAHKLTLATCAITSYLKAPEAWPLRDQMLRAAISIPSNMAREQGAGLTAISAASSGIRWVPAMNLSMILSLRVI